LERRKYDRGRSSDRVFEWRLDHARPLALLYPQS
jgi:hypothetical protein